MVLPPQPASGEKKSSGAILSEMVGGFGPDEERVQHLLNLFPVPSFNDAWPLLKTLQEIALDVRWVPAGLGRSDEVEFLARVLAKIDQAIGHIERFDVQPRLTGIYALAGTMVGQEAVPMPGPVRLRAALWVCRERWHTAGARRSSAAATLATALRGSLENHKAGIDTHALARHLGKFAQANTLAEFIEAASVLLESERVDLATAWRHFDSELRSIRDAAPIPNPVPPSRPPPLPDAGLEEAGFDEDKLLDSLARGTRQGLFVSADAPQPLPGEPADEVAISNWMGTLPSSAKNPDAEAMARQRLSQAIWGSNWLQLANHPDVLTRDEYSLVLRALVEDLAAGNQAEPLLFGCAMLLVQGITGRSADTLRALRCVNSFNGSLGADTFEIQADARALRLPVAWNQRRVETGERERVGFAPTAAQESWLEPVATDFLLPLPPDLASALASHLGKLTGIAAKPVEMIESALRQAARHVSERLDFRVSAGLVRRSFAAHLFEHCRDMALTQMICADSLGQSTAPLHYYAPTRHRIAASYWIIVGECFGGELPLPDRYVDDTRAGSALLVRTDRARSLAALPSAILQGGVSRLVKAGESVKVHAAMVDHLACMLLVVGGHRPVDALFRLTLRQFDLESSTGAALFRDKVHDSAHDPRLVALAPCVVRQIHAYLQHLQGLAQLQPRLKSRVERVLAGKEALLFDIDARGEDKVLDIGTLRERLPAEWRELPLHWGRTTLRTRLVEAGLGPELASIQLGHLEAVGYAFSGSSPTEPMAFVAAVAPHLERLAVRQGWVVRRGLTSPSGVEIPLRALRRWGSHVKDHELAMRAHARAWREQRRALLRRYRKEAERHVLELPELVAAGIPSVFSASEGPWSGASLLKERAEALRDALLVSADDAAMALARARALVGILKNVNRKLGTRAQDPGKIVLLRRPLDNALVPDLFDAVRQVRALRLHLESLGAGAPEPWRDFSMACARVAYALCVFGFCDSPAQVMGALEHRCKFSASAVMEDVLLLPWGPSPDQVIGLRGLAALAMAKLAKKYPKDTVPSQDELNAKLEHLLPEWAKPPRKEAGEEGAVASTPNLLGVLCETVSMSNRYELSPACRLALGDKGSTNASMREQIGLLDDDPAGTMSHGEGSSPMPTREAIQLDGGSGSARSQYKALCRVLPHAGKDLDLPLTDQRILAANLFSETTRAKVIAEVRAMQADTRPGKALRPVVRLLASWVEQMLVEGTAAKADPADITILTYLTRIGGGLVEALGHGTLRDLGDDELADAYVQVVQCKAGSRSKAASAILGFHAHGEAVFDLPDIDLSEIRSYLAKEEVRADANLLLPSERAAAITDLMTETSTDISITRRQRQAAAAMSFYAFGGARRSEVLGVRFSDIAMSDGAVTMRLRANRSRRLKTRSARRTVCLIGGRARASLDASAAWIRQEGTRFADQQRPRAFVFSPLDALRSALDRHKIADTCRQALARASGRHAEKLHRLRHLVAFEQMIPIFLSTADYGRLSHFLTESRALDRNEGVELPRDLLARVVLLGHCDPATTIVSYFHMPWLLRSRADQRLAADFLQRRGVAAVCGVKVETADDITRKSDKPKVTAWFDAMRTPRRKPKSSGKVEESAPLRKHAWTACELGRVLQLVSRNGSLEDTLAIIGADPKFSRILRSTALSYEIRFGRRLLDEDWQVGGPRPRRVARVPRRAVTFESLWRCFDEEGGEARADFVDVAEAIYAWMHAKDESVVRIPTELAERAVKIVMRAGLAPRGISQSTSGDFVLLRIGFGESPSDGEEPDGEAGSGRQASAAPRGPAMLSIAFKRAMGVIWLAARLNK